MLLEQYIDKETSTYTYLIADTDQKLAVLIDPVDTEIETYLKKLTEYELTLKYVLDTHTHADHVSANGKLRDMTECITCMGAESKATCIDRQLVDREILTLGSIEIEALHTPGHTDDSYCFHVYWGNQHYLFTGDTLLINGSGRTDFQNGSARDQYKSIFHTLLGFPDTTIVYPGHDYNQKILSTIGQEKRQNPRLQVNSEEAYIELMSKLNLPSPKYMDIAVPANQACGKRAIN